jgi:hypothetical protein
LVSSARNSAIAAEGFRRGVELKALTTRHRWTWHEDRMHALVLAD